MSARALIWTYAGRYKWLYLGGFLCLITASVVVMLPPLVLRHAIDSIDDGSASRWSLARYGGIILDQTMPMLTGPETLRQIRSINPSVRALFASSTPKEANVRPGEVLGVIAKPYRERELLQWVHIALEHQ